MNVRDDLLSLDPEKLAALANRGLVKRAQKWLIQEKAPIIEEQEHGLVVATLGNVRTELAIGVPLGNCLCTCSAHKTCWHRVLAVLAYQEHAKSLGLEAPTTLVMWSPGSVDDAALATLLGSRAFARAKRQRNQGQVVHLVRPSASQSTPVATLSTCTVRFLVPGDLAHVRCDCELAVACEHVALAVWAFRQGDRLTPEPPIHQIVEFADGTRNEESHQLGPALDVASTVLMDGVEGSGRGLASSFAHAREPLERAGLRWPVDLLEEIEALLDAYHRWDGRYGIELVASRITELFARDRAASQGGLMPRQAVLGLGHAPETTLSQLCLLSLGAEVTEEGDKIVCRIFFADPSSGTTLVWRRAWPLLTNARPSNYQLRSVLLELVRRDSQFVSSQKLAGVALRNMSCGQVTTRRARRRANRGLTLAGGRVSQTTVMPQSGDWDETLVAPLLISDLSKESPTVPRYVRSRFLADNVRVVAISQIEDIRFRPSLGVLEAIAIDSMGNPFSIEIEEKAVTPNALGAAAVALEGDMRFVSGFLSPRPGTWAIQALALVNHEMVVPALAMESRSKPPISSSADHRLGDPVRDTLRNLRKAMDDSVQCGLRRATQLENRLQEYMLDLAALRMPVLERRVAMLCSALQRMHTHGDEAGLAQAWFDTSLRIDLLLEQS